MVGTAHSAAAATTTSVSSATPGVCVYTRHDNGSLYVLMLREDEEVALSRPGAMTAAAIAAEGAPAGPGPSFTVQWWTFPGGKRDKGRGGFTESEPAQTAAREVEEEMHGTLTAEGLGALLRTSPGIWWEEGKYALFMVELPDEWECDLPAVFDAKVTAGNLHREAPKSKGLRWVPLYELRAMLAKGMPNSSKGARQEVVRRALASTAAPRPTATPAAKGAESLPSLHFVAWHLLKRAGAVDWLTRVEAGAGRRGQSSGVGACTEIERGGVAAPVERWWRWAPLAAGAGAAATATAVAGAVAVGNASRGGGQRKPWSAGGERCRRGHQPDLTRVAWTPEALKEAGAKACSLKARWSLGIERVTPAVDCKTSASGRRRPAAAAAAAAAAASRRRRRRPAGGSRLMVASFFDVLSDREEAQHQALWPAFLAAKVAGKRAQFHRARLVVDGERVPAPAC
ncbi:hypothetical protein FOA52_010173 [Chlamydomonas sp. UWO 241]|nr:hypothetical protein FOA52_010173 [Chlamydomonas sp. UWO 241]